jgi:hypothetical protein
MRGAILLLPKTPLLRGAQLKKHRDNFIYIYREREREREGVSKSYRTELITKYTLQFGIIRSEATQKVTAAKLTILTHKIAIQLHVMAESCTICNSRSRRTVWKLLDTPSYIWTDV